MDRKAELQLGITRRELLKGAAGAASLFFLSKITDQSPVYAEIASRTSLEDDFKYGDLKTCSNQMEVRVVDEKGPVKDAKIGVVVGGKQVGTASSNEQGLAGVQIRADCNTTVNGYDGMRVQTSVIAPDGRRVDNDAAFRDGVVVKPTVNLRPKQAATPQPTVAPTPQPPRTPEASPTATPIAPVPPVPGQGPDWREIALIGLGVLGLAGLVGWLLHSRPRRTPRGDGHSTTCPPGDGNCPSTARVYQPIDVVAHPRIIDIPGGHSRVPCPDGGVSASPSTTPSTGSASSSTQPPRGSN